MQICYDERFLLVFETSFIEGKAQIPYLCTHNSRFRFSYNELMVYS